MIDETDRGVIEALRIDGRAPFSQIASVLGVSTQTVSRRYGRLTSEASLRVVGLPNVHEAGQTQWMVRLTASPHAAQDVAHALARRPDTSWVRVLSGGTEVFLVITNPGNTFGRNSLLFRDIPRTAGVTAVSAHSMLHSYLAGPTAERGRATVLTDEQHRRLSPSTPLHLSGSPSGLSGKDRPLLAALQRNGRATHADLATATGWSESTVARRLATLQAGNLIFFDVEIDDSALGNNTSTLLWASVAPARLGEVASLLAQHEELAHVATTTGPTNLVALVSCRTPADLHNYLIERIGSVDAIRALETAPVLQTLKRSSSILIGEPSRGQAALLARKAS